MKVVLLVARRVRQLIRAPGARTASITPGASIARISALLASSLATLTALTTGTAHAAGQTSPGYIMNADVVNNGVADMSSAAYTLRSSLGDGVAGGVSTSASFRLANGFRGDVNAPAAVINLLTVISRKLHGGLPFKIDIDKNIPLTGNVSVEPRSIGSGHTLVFHFDGVVSSVAAVTALDAALNSAATASFSFTAGSPDVVVTLTNTGENKKMRITLAGVNGGADVSASLAFLTGDATQSGLVSAADIAAIRANYSKPVSDATAKFDLNLDGSITPADLDAAKARTGRKLTP